MTFEETLDAEGKLIYTNKGVSMMPLLRENRDIMVIHKRKGADCRPYDAVLFIRPGVAGRGHYVLHRILRRNPDGSFWIVGDNCVSGENVKEKEILGVLTSVIRDGKEVKTTDLLYRIYVRLWCRPYHFRFFVLRGKRFLRRCLSFVKRRVLRIGNR